MVRTRREVEQSVSRGTVGAAPGGVNADKPRQSPGDASLDGPFGGRATTTCSFCESPMPVEDFCMNCWEVC